MHELENSKSDQTKKSIYERLTRSSRITRRCMLASVGVALVSHAQKAPIDRDTFLTLGLTIASMKGAHERFSATQFAKNKIDEYKTYYFNKTSVYRSPTERTKMILENNELAFTDVQDRTAIASEVAPLTAGASIFLSGAAFEIVAERGVTDLFSVGAFALASCMYAVDRIVAKSDQQAYTNMVENIEGRIL
ncbi:MAG TPA: hypothetical protein PKD20_01315 [Candidatus Saccharibacteria bacterium]|jgi:hypothetical protein|nr:hypothetical protein [Candidatus Saccharibacteria bacterium]